jgi:hypothetical protein
MSSHDRLVLRSRALHRAVATKIRTHPRLIRKVEENLERWIGMERESGSVSLGLLEWRELLRTRPLEDILDLISQETEEADRLRHATPFSGILTEEERAEICRQYAASST